MGLDDDAHILRIASAHGASDTYVPFPAGFEHDTIPLQTAFQGQGQLAQFVRSENIHPALVQHHIRLEVVKDGVHVVLEQGQIEGVLGSIRERYIQRAGFLAEWVVGRTVHAKSENAIGAAGHCSRAVALMHV